MRKLVIGLLLSLMASGCQSYTVKKDLSYEEIPPPGTIFPGVAPFNRFDLYLPNECPVVNPKPERGWPVIIAIHGGAWQSGDKADMQKFADEFCGAGYAVVSPNYRLSTASSGWYSTKWPAQLVDVQSAICYVWSNAATFGLNRNKLATLGVSAGGHLATMAALRDDRNISALMFLHPRHPSVAVDLDGEMDMTLAGDKCMATFDDIMAHVSGITPVTSNGWSDPAKRTPAMKKLCEDISPVKFARPDVHLFIVHGESDSNVYVANAHLIESAIQQVGGDVEKHIVTGKAGFCHGSCWEDPSVLPALHKFLDKHLKTQ